MQINVDRTTAGFNAEKSEKPGKIAQAIKSDASSGAKNVPYSEPGDEVELSNRKTALLNSTSEANMAASSTEAGADRLNAIRQKLSSLNNYIQDNPLEAISAQANLDPATVARLIG